MPRPVSPLWLFSSPPSTIISLFLTLIIDLNLRSDWPGGAPGEERAVKSDWFTVTSNVICSSPDTMGLMVIEKSPLTGFYVLVTID